MTSWSQVALVHPCKHAHSLLRSLRSLRVVLSPPNAQKTNQNGSFFIFLLVQKHSNMVVAPPAHHVCYDLLVASGARSFVQAHSLAITLTSFTTSLIVSTKCTKNEPKRFVFLFSCWCKSTRTWWLHHLHTLCAMTSWSQVALVHSCRCTRLLLRLRCQQ